MKELTTTDLRTLNAGTTYVCPFCHGVSGGYWKVYAHALFGGCFKRNRYLNGIYRAAGWCFSTALTNEVCRFLNVSFIRGKHAR